MVRRHWFLAFPSPLSTHRQSGTMDERHESVVGSSAERRASASLSPFALSIRGTSGEALRLQIDRARKENVSAICRDSGPSHSGTWRTPLWEAEFLWSARRCRTFHRLSGECRIEGVPRLIDKSLPGRSDAAPGDPLGRRSDHRRGADRARSLAMGTVRASGVHSYMDRDLRLERRDRDVRHRVRVVDH